ncbi:hypothetical protein ACH5RR_007043 [Cinchona calisaya]|uniref:Aminotransferase-like plant mobile domain-containing protein n=1 Tax=Cinchona calisaya TaxID=153742 RepID=A0ABD3AQN5_9GENT
MSAFVNVLRIPLANSLLDEAYVQRIRICLIILIGDMLLSDASSRRISLYFMSLLEDLHACGQYSWGSAVLAFLYRKLCNAFNTRHYTQISGPLAILQNMAQCPPQFAANLGKMCDKVFRGMQYAQQQYRMELGPSQRHDNMPRGDRRVKGNSFQIFGDNKHFGISRTQPFSSSNARDNDGPLGHGTPLGFSS